MASPKPTATKLQAGLYHVHRDYDTCFHYYVNKDKYGDWMIFINSQEALLSESVFEARLRTKTECMQYIHNKRQLYMDWE